MVNFKRPRHIRLRGETVSAPVRCSMADSARRAAESGEAITASARTQTAADRLGKGLGLPHPELLVHLHQCQELGLFLRGEGCLPLLAEKLVQTMPLLGSHLHLRQGKYLGIRQCGDGWGIARWCADRSEDQRQRLGQELRYFSVGQGRPVLRVCVASSGKVTTTCVLISPAPLHQTPAPPTGLPKNHGRVPRHGRVGGAAGSRTIPPPRKV